MALYWSTGLRQFISQHGSYKRALHGGCMIIYSGTVPSNANDAAGSGTAQLVQISLGSGAYDPEDQASASITLSGSGGQVDTFTVGKSGETAVEIMGAVVPYVTSLTQTATNVVAQVQTYLSNPEYEVSSSGAVITVKSLLGTGTAQNAFVATMTVSGGTLAEDAPQSLAGGDAADYGLTYLYGVDGVITATGTWSGVVTNTGTASYWRIYGPNGNEWGSPSSSTSQIRIQGTCGTSGTDYIMSSTSLTATTTHTVGAFNLTLPAS